MNAKCKRILAVEYFVWMKKRNRKYIYTGALPNVCTLSVSATKNTWKHNTANYLFPEYAPVNVMCHNRAKRKEKVKQKCKKVFSHLCTLSVPPGK